MTPNILSVDHNIINYRICPEPEEFTGNDTHLLATVLRRHMPEPIETITYGNNQAVKYEVTLTVKQILNREKELIQITLQSVFIFSKSKEDPGDEFWCYLLLKAIEGLKNAYYLTTKDTFLKNTRLAITKTMEEDCQRQRNIYRLSVSN
jgi:hypothetical protein